MKKSGEYRLKATGCWIVSPSAQKILDRIERHKGKKPRRKGQKKK